MSLCIIWLFIPGQVLDDNSDVPNLYGSDHLFYSARKQVQALDSEPEDSHCQSSVYMNNYSPSHPESLCKDLKTRSRAMQCVPSPSKPHGVPCCCPLVCLSRGQVSAWSVSGTRWCSHGFAQGQGVRQSSNTHFIDSELQIYSFQTFRVKHIAAFSGRAMMVLIEICRSEDNFRVND